MTQEKKLSRHIGVLLTNLGTPDAPTPAATRKYLAEFLSDTRVIEKPKWLWKIILYGIILNVRPRKAAKAYQSVWTENGSPLLYFSEQQTHALQQLMSSDETDTHVSVKLAMRYGNPSVELGIKELLAEKPDCIIVLPLYPQYSATTTASTYDAVFNAIKDIRDLPEIQLLGAYNQHEQYITALANSIQEHWQQHGQADKLMMSFHGLPEQYIKKGDPYQSQCFQTAQLLAEKLELPEERWKCTFQSRFGVEQWIQPYTDKVLQAWGQAGIESVDVVCPGFSADCLETLEEIAMENKELFIEAGGKAFNYIPCLNDRDDHIELFKQIIEAHIAN